MSCDESNQCVSCEGSWSVTAGACQQSATVHYHVLDKFAGSFHLDDFKLSEIQANPSVKVSAGLRFAASAEVEEELPEPGDDSHDCDDDDVIEKL